MWKIIDQLLFYQVSLRFLKRQHSYNFYNFWRPTIEQTTYLDYPNRSVKQAIVQFIERPFVALNSGQRVMVCFLGLSRTFESRVFVWGNVLFHHLEFCPDWGGTVSVGLGATLIGKNMLKIGIINWAI